MVAPRPYHQRQYPAAGESRCFACGASSWRRGEECPGARAALRRVTRLEVLLREVVAHADAEFGCVVPQELLGRILDAMEGAGSDGE